MRDYMKALCYKFETISRRAEYLDRKIERTYRQLTRLLDEPERKHAEDGRSGRCLQEEACLNSFISGYRLAQGIQQELLADQPPYNFTARTNSEACELAKENDQWGRNVLTVKAASANRKDGEVGGFCTASYDPATGEAENQECTGEDPGGG
ncbi:MAG: hypothetical protein ACLT1A_00425 [Dysosmobacter sp.]